MTIWAEHTEGGFILAPHRNKKSAMKTIIISIIIIMHFVSHFFHIEFGLIFLKWSSMYIYV